MEDKTNFYVLVMVAIVAIVGLIVMVAGNSGTKYASTTSDEAGQATQATIPVGCYYKNVTTYVGTASLTYTYAFDIHNCTYIRGSSDPFTVTTVTAIPRFGEITTYTDGCRGTPETKPVLGKYICSSDGTLIYYVYNCSEGCGPPCLKRAVITTQLFCPRSRVA